MDLAEVLRRAAEIVHSANEPAPTPTPITPDPPVVVTPPVTVDASKVELPPAPPCMCGHPEDAHAETGECEILECDCESYLPGNVPSPVKTKVLEFKVPPTVTEDESEPDSPGELVEDVSPASGEEAVGSEPPTASIFPQMTDGSSHDICQHLCDACNQWWSHGPVDKCRYPDLLKQGKCPNCLGVNEHNVDPLDDFEIKDGKPVIQPQAQLKIRNNEREVCKNMSVQQLTAHIQFHARRIVEFQVRSMEARHLRSELEEEQLANIPQEERDKFIQALRRGNEENGKKPHKSAAKKVAEDDMTGLSKAERHIRGLMRTLGKSREQIEKMLND